MQLQVHSSGGDCFDRGGQYSIISVGLTSGMMELIRVDVYLERLRRFFVPRLSIDRRGLAVFRIGLGVTVLLDLCFRATDLVFFYTNKGVLPTYALHERFPLSSYISLHALSGSPLFEALLFVVAGIFAVFLILGYYSRLSVLVSFFLLVSLHTRNPILLNAGDSLLKRLFFWSIFLPIGGKWSVDAVRRNRLPGDGTVSTVASAALLIQVVLMYTVNSYFKFQGDIWMEGDAVVEVFGIDRLTVRLGDVMTGIHPLLEFFDYFWLLLISFSILLILLPGWYRNVFTGLFMVMHLGMGLTMNLGLFPLISILSLTPFLSSGFWSFFEEKLRSQIDIWRGFTGSISSVLPEIPYRIPSSVSNFVSTIKPFVVLFFLVAVLWWNASTMGLVESQEVGTLDPEQNSWSMFAPHPPTNDGWWVVSLERKDGSVVDPRTREPPEFEPPSEFAETFGSHRKMLYLLDVTDSKNRVVKDDLLRFYCEKYAEPKDTVEVFFIQDKPDGSREREEIGSRHCA
ncbi:MAG: HTTM domain-containing protein [Halobacteria archaeon]